MKHFGHCVVLAGVLAGCGSYGNQAIRNETEQTISQKVVKGVTTKTQVKAVLGDPSFTTFTDSGNEQWMYQFSSYAVRPTSLVPYLSLLDSGVNGDNKSITILFDKKGVVLNYSVSNSAVQSQSGILPAGAY
jgi:outer membrane protein assembly factor BamE (lipoprotein component of BamABCDE complex)